MAHTKRKPPRARRPQTTPRSKAPPNGSGGGDVEQHAKTVLASALAEGHRGARAAASIVPSDLMPAVLAVCLPEEWSADDEAQALIHRLSNADAQVVLGWLGAQWREGYAARVADEQAGRPPLTELLP